MSNYRKAKKGEIRCDQCAVPFKRHGGKRLICAFRDWWVVAKGGTCDRAEAMIKQ